MWRVYITVVALIAALLVGASFVRAQRTGLDPVPGVGGAAHHISPSGPRDLDPGADISTPDLEPIPDTGSPIEVAPEIPAIQTPAQPSCSYRDADGHVHSC